MNVGQHRDAAIADTFENAQTFLYTGAAVGAGAGAVGFVERRFKDERTGDFADLACEELDVFFAFNDAGTGDERQRLALADLNLGTDFDGHDADRGSFAAQVGSRRRFADAFHAPLVMIEGGADEGLNSGCGSSGLDLNSGWNWQPRYQGWSASFADFDVDAVGRFAGEAQAVLLSECPHIRG